MRSAQRCFLLALLAIAMTIYLLARNYGTALSATQSPVPAKSRPCEGPVSRQVHAPPGWVQEVWRRLGPVAARAGLQPIPPIGVTPFAAPNACYRGNLIEMTEGILPLLGGSPGETAFTLAHEAGHGLQRFNPRGTATLHEFLHSLYYGSLHRRDVITRKEKEILADLWGFCLMSAAGYNYYDAFGFFGKFEGYAGTGWDRAAREGVLGGESRIWKDQHPGDAHRISYLHRAAERGLPQQCAKASR